ncbi:hypothetical protein F4679DRAFT_540507 [Xylaria curta]|nr:hypothetical protein F4679DRAFT_540507 [Xylaria curta]
MLIACGIITNNAFDDIYLSEDLYGKENVTLYEGILKHGDYWLPLRGKELPESESDSTSTDQDDREVDELHQYPIVANFENWLFSHGKLLTEWRKQHNPPLSL